MQCLPQFKKKKKQNKEGFQIGDIKTDIKQEKRVKMKIMLECYHYARIVQHRFLEHQCHHYCWYLQLPNRNAWMLGGDMG